MANIFNRRLPVKSARFTTKTKKKKDASPKSIVYSHITLNEIQAQIAVGAIKSNSIPGLVQITDDMDVINWALSHRLASVRTAAISHAFCPFGHLIEKLLSDTAVAVRNACRTALNQRPEEVKLFLDLLQDYPQFTLALGDVRKTITIINKENQNTKTDEDYDKDYDEDPPF